MEFRGSFVGVEVDWTDVEALYERYGLTPAAPSQASRVAVPLYSGEKQVGKATTTSWSPILKKMIALASVETEHSEAGDAIADGDYDRGHPAEDECEGDGAAFFNPARKTATPVVVSTERAGLRPADSRGGCPHILISAPKKINSVRPIPPASFPCQAGQGPNQSPDVGGRNCFLIHKDHTAVAVGFLQPRS